MPDEFITDSCSVKEPLAIYSGFSIVASYLPSSMLTVSNFTFVNETFDVF